MTISGQSSRNENDVRSAYSNQLVDRITACMSSTTRFAPLPDRSSKVKQGIFLVSGGSDGSLLLPMTGFDQIFAQFRGVASKKTKSCLPSLRADDGLALNVFGIRLK